MPIIIKLTLLGNLDYLNFGLSKFPYTFFYSLTIEDLSVNVILSEPLFNIGKDMSKWTKHADWFM